MAEPEETDRTSDGAGVQSRWSGRSRRRSLGVLGALAIGAVAVILVQSLTGAPATVAGAEADAAAPAAATGTTAVAATTAAAEGSDSDAVAHEKLLAEGKQTFRFDTFGERDASGATRCDLDEAIAGEANGGVGPA